MDFGFTPDQDTLRASVQRFMRERVAPRIAMCEREREFARRLWRAERGAGEYGHRINLSKRGADCAIPDLSDRQWLRKR